MRLLAVIPARGGSKGLPGKNLMTVGGVSLVGRAVLAAREALDSFASELSDARILVDTDDEAIAAEGRRWGAMVPFLRPAELAGDAVPMVDNVLCAVTRMAAEPSGIEADAVLLLQPTSPLRTADDILRCLHRYAEIICKHDDIHQGQVRASVVAVTPADHVPEQSLHLVATEGDTDGPADEIRWAFPASEPTRRRQDFVPAYRPSGSVYVSSVGSLRAARSFFVPGQTRGIVVTRERSIDIDDRLDLQMARELHRLQLQTTHTSIGDADSPPLPLPLQAYDFDDLRRFEAAEPKRALVLPADFSLHDALAAVRTFPPELVIVSTWADFRRLRGVLTHTLPIALASDDLAAHALALAEGASAFVAPAALHPEIMRVSRMIGYPAVYQPHA